MSPSEVWSYFQLKQTKDDKKKISRRFLLKTLETRQLDDVKRSPRCPERQFGKQEFPNKRVAKIDQITAGINKAIIGLTVEPYKIQWPSWASCDTKSLMRI